MLRSLCKSLQPFLLAAAFVASLASSALAHVGHAGHETDGHVHPFVVGWEHPFFGIDHLLAMVAVGLLAIRLGGAALWAMPSAFLGCMVLGGLAAAAGVPLPGVEYGIVASVLVLGLVIAAMPISWERKRPRTSEAIAAETPVEPTRRRLLLFAAALVGLFAVFHGYAHAVEMPPGESLALYAAGFVLATALLHVSGLLSGLALSRGVGLTAIRLTGGAITAAGLSIALGLL